MANNYRNTDIDTDRPLYSLDDESIYAIADDEACGAESSATACRRTRFEPYYEEEPAYGEYAVSDDEDEREADNEAGNGNLFLLLARIMSTPVEGWKMLRRRRFSPERIASGLFYPLAALAALSEFSDLIYSSETDTGETVLRAFRVFITFFFGYFTIILAARMLLPRDVMKVLPRDVARGYVMANMSTLAIFMTLYNCLPMLEPVIVFMPLWTIYLIFKGVRILRVPAERTTRVQCTMTLCIIGIPIVWERLTGLIL